MKKLIFMCLVSMVTFGCVSSGNRFLEKEPTLQTKNETVVKAKTDERKPTSYDNYCLMFYNNNYYSDFIQKAILDAESHIWKLVGGSERFKLHYLEDRTVLLEGNKMYKYFFDITDARYYDVTDRNEWIQFKCPSLETLKELSYDNQPMYITMNTRINGTYQIQIYMNYFSSWAFRKFSDMYLHPIKSEYRRELENK